jgi:predicted AAA+ superfamily ATPase
VSTVLPAATEASVDERPRRLEPIIDEALRAFRVVVVTGPRQAGKTTLVQRTLAGGGRASSTGRCNAPAMMAV